MATFVVSLGRGRMLGHNRHPVPPEGYDKGWRPFVWVRDLIDAEKFGSRQAATLFARSAVHHDQWEVIQISGDAEDMLA